LWLGSFANISQSCFVKDIFNIINLVLFKDVSCSFNKIK